MAFKSGGWVMVDVFGDLWEPIGFGKGTYKFQRRIKYNFILHKPHSEIGMRVQSQQLFFIFHLNYNNRIA